VPVPDRHNSDDKPITGTAPTDNARIGPASRTHQTPRPRDGADHLSLTADTIRIVNDGRPPNDRHPGRRSTRFQVVAYDLPGHRYPTLDAFHRNHAVVESAIKDGKDLGLRRLPGYALAFNQAWCTAVAIACDLLAWLRLLALDHHQHLCRANPATLRRMLLNVPARLVRRARKRLIRLDDTHPHQADLILAWNKIHAMATPP
jgi:hypothetical protein